MLKQEKGMIRSLKTAKNQACLKVTTPRLIVKLRIKTKEPQDKVQSRKSTTIETGSMEAVTMTSLREVRHSKMKQLTNRQKKMPNSTDKLIEQENVLIHSKVRIIEKMRSILDGC